jgi:hypothetical protein
MSKNSSDCDLTIIVVSLRSLLVVFRVVLVVRVFGMAVFAVRVVVVSTHAFLTSLQRRAEKWIHIKEHLLPM